MLVGGGVVAITANNFERIAGKTSNKWRDMIKVRAPGAAATAAAATATAPAATAAPGAAGGAGGGGAGAAGGGPSATATARRASPLSLREWAARRGVALADPDVEAALASARVGYEDERVPYEGVGRRAPVGEGWVAVEEPASGGFAVGYVWRARNGGSGGGSGSGSGSGSGANGELLYISLHPEPPRAAAAGGAGGGAKGGGEAGAPKRKRGERGPRARPFDPAMQRWFALPGEPLPHPERLELLTHPQAVRVRVVVFAFCFLCCAPSCTA